MDPSLHWPRRIYPVPGPDAAQEESWTEPRPVNPGPDATQEEIQRYLSDMIAWRNRGEILPEPAGSPRYPVHPGPGATREEISHYYRETVMWRLRHQERGEPPDEYPLRDPYYFLGPQVDADMQPHFVRRPYVDPPVVAGLFPLSQTAFIDFLIEVADKSVTGLVTLSAFCATYFLAWAKPGTVCLAATEPNDFIPSWLHVLFAGPNDSIPSWQQIFFVSLPFLVYPIALYTSGSAKVAEQNHDALGHVATIVLLEVSLAIFIGGEMANCMSGVSLLFARVVTTVLIALVVFAWGCMFNHPKFLKKFVSMCCCQTLTEDDQAEADQQQEDDQAEADQQQQDDQAEADQQQQDYQQLEDQQ